MATEETDQLEERQKAASSLSLEELKQVNAELFERVVARTDDETPSSPA